MGFFSKALVLAFGAAIVYVFLSSGLAAQGWKRAALLVFTLGALVLLAAMGYTLFVVH